MTSLFDLLLLAMGAYVLIAGITGRGRLYAADNIKEGMEEKFRKTMRKVYLGLGIVMVLNGVVSLLMNLLYTTRVVQEATETTAAVTEIIPQFELGFWSFLTPGLLTALVYVCMGLIVALIVLMIVMLRKFTDRNAPRGASPQNDRQAGHILPVDAFEFDEPEETASAQEPAPPDGN